MAFIINFTDGHTEEIQATKFIDAGQEGTWIDFLSPVGGGSYQQVLRVRAMDVDRIAVKR